MGQKIQRPDPRIDETEEQPNGDKPHSSNMPQPLGDLAEAIFETKELVSHIAEELLVHGHKLERHGEVIGTHGAKLDLLTGAVNTLSEQIAMIGTVPPIRARAHSVHDLVNEATDGGTRHFFGTDDDIEDIVDARLKAREKKKALEHDAGIFRWFKGKMLHVAGIILVSSIMWILVNFWDDIKRLVGKH